ncbi:MAG: hypothetical protein AABN33_06000 [Acidobacteriota bacterium]
MRYAFTVGIIIAVFTSCSNGDLKSKPFLVGNYDCVAYNKTGNAVINGALSIDADQFNGHWRFAKSSDAEQVDVEYIDGTGNLVGRVDQKAVTINFNPSMSDANWIVDATIEGDRLVGHSLLVGLCGWTGGRQI